MATTIQTIQKPTKARALDTSGNNNHGQIYSGRALEFDGVSDYLNTVNYDLSSGSNLTVAIWAYSNVTDGTDRTFVNQETNWRLMRTAANTVLWTVATSNNAWYNVTMSSTDVLDNAWNRIVATYDGANMKIYVNGVLSATSGSITGTLLNAASHTFSIGAAYSSSTWSEFYDGDLCDVQLWNATWTAEDVLYDYNNPEQLALNRGGTSLTNSNLKAWYPMNDGHRGQQSYILDASNTGLGDELLADTDVNDSSAWNGQNASGSSEMTFSNGEAYSTGSAQWMTQPNVTKHNDGYMYKSVIRAKRATAGEAAVLQVYHGANSTKTHTLTDDYVDYTTYLANDAGSGSDHFYIYNNSGNIKVTSASFKKINAKNHATTVFYGDEKVANGDMNVTDPATVTIGGVAATVHDATFDDSTSITDHTDTDTNNKTIKVTGDSSSQYPLIRWSDGSNMGLVTGRTYYVEVWVYIPSSNSLIDKVQLKVMDNAASTELLSNVTTTTDTWTKLSGTFVDDDIARIDIVGIDTDGSSGGAQDFSSEVFYIDDLSVKEVGTASGWTDADQQLNIPQTALQSYNQLAWFPGQEGSDVTLDTTIDTLATAWSFSFWLFNMESGNSFDFIIGAGSNRNLAVDNNSNRKLYYRDGDGVYNALSDEVIPEGKWLHIVVTAIADTSITAYINGEAQTTSTTMAYGGSDPDTQLIVDRFMEGYSAGNYESRGSITEISYFANTTLNQAQVNTLYNDGKAYDVEKDTTLWSACTAYWRNNGLAEWQDRKGTNDLNTNGVTETMLITAGVDGSRDSQGFLMNRQRATNSLNNALGTSGIKNYVEMNVGGDDDLAFIGVGHGFSVSVWVKKYQLSSENQMIVSRNNNVDGWRLQIDSLNKLQFAVEENNNISTGITDSAISTDTWYHMVGTFDGDPSNNGSGVVKLYINGVTGGSTTNDAASNDMDTAIDTMYIGKHTTGGDFFNGEIDDLCIYNKVLSQEEVTRNYNAGKRSHR
jgi:hypothetical protein